jgi:hypothetical protein
MVRVLVTGLVLLLAAGCQTGPATTTTTPAPSASEEPAAPPPSASHIPAGTVLTATLSGDLSTREAKIGDTFTVAVQNPLIAENRDTVVATGTVITGMVTGIGSEQEQSAIRLNFTRIALDGASHPFTAAITATQFPEETRSNHDVERAAGNDSTAAPFGAVIGKGTLRDTLVRGALGAGAGTIISLGHGAPRILPTGTQLTLRTVDQIDLQTR